MCGGGGGGGKRVGVGRADLILGKKCDGEDDCVMFPRQIVIGVKIYAFSISG